MPEVRVRLGEGVVVVAPLVEALLLRVARGRTTASAPDRPTRLVSEPRDLDSVGYVAEQTSVLLTRPGEEVEVLPAGSLVLPSLLGRSRPTYVVLTHDPVDVWLRLGPFETSDGRTVQQVELSLTVSLAGSPSGLHDLAESAWSGPAGQDPPGGPPDLGEVVLDRLAREVTARTTEAVRRRTLTELTSLSLGVLLDQALPTTFLGGLLSRSRLEVVDVDWPTEGRGWTGAALPWTGDSGGRPGTVPR